MKRTRIKICGIRTTKDALFAASLGADALGFVFYEKSPRHVSVEQASQICRELPAFINKVALFVNPEKTMVQDVISNVSIDTLQFHGEETLDFCEQFDLPFIKAVSVKENESADEVLNRLNNYAKANAILLDRFDETLVGGTGQPFNWKLIPESFKNKIILAGGLDSNNVSNAIAEIQPYGVDVSSGVEKARGEKDLALMEAFVKAVHKADYQQKTN